MAKPGMVVAPPPAGSGLHDLAALLAVMKDPEAVEAKLAELRAALDTIEAERKSLAAEIAECTKRHVEAEKATLENVQRAESLDLANREAADRDAKMQAFSEGLSERAKGLDEAAADLEARGAALAAREEEVARQSAETEAHHEHIRQILREAMELEAALADVKKAVGAARAKISKAGG